MTRESPKEFEGDDDAIDRRLNEPAKVEPIAPPRPTTAARPAESAGGRIRPERDGEERPGEGSVGNGGAGEGQRENQPPIAVDDFPRASYERPINIDVLHNKYGVADDFDPDGDSIDINNVEDGDGGTTKIMRPGDDGYSPDVTNPPGRSYVVYTPKPGFFGQDEFHYTIKDDKGATSNTTAVGVVVSLPSSLSVYADDRVSADDHQTVIEAEVFFAGADAYADDGTTIAWGVKGPDESVTRTQTTTESGVASYVLDTSTHAGDVYRVYAKVAKAAVDGGDLHEISDPDVFSETELRATIVVRPGRAAEIVVDPERERLPSDGNSTTRVTITARDKAGNLVADGSPVSWGLVGSGSLVSMDAETTQGRASATVRAGIYPGPLQLSVAVDGLAAGKELRTLPLVVRLGVTGNALTLGTDETQTVTANVADADGNPVADGTKIDWYSQKGSIVGQAVVTGGVAAATLKATGGSPIPGRGAIRAFVGSKTGTIWFDWLAPARGAYDLRAQVSQRVIAGDVTTAGSYPIEQPDGSIVPYDYQTSSLVEITGPPNAVVQVNVGNFDPKADLLTVNDQNTFTTVTLDANGRGVLHLKSKGISGDKAMVVPITATIEQSWWNRFVNWWWGENPGGATPSNTTTFTIAVEPARLIAGTRDFVGKLAWGALPGETGSPEEIAGDLAFGLIPDIGGRADFRDAGGELARLWPVGESPDWRAFGFAVFVIATSFMGPRAAWPPIPGKRMAKALDASKGVWRTVMDLVKKGDFAKLDEVGPLLERLADPANDRLKHLAEMVLAAKSGEDLVRLNRIVDGLGAEDTVAFFERVGKTAEDEAR